MPDLDRGDEGEECLDVQDGGSSEIEGGPGGVIGPVPLGAEPVGCVPALLQMPALEQTQRLLKTSNVWLTRTPFDGLPQRQPANRAQLHSSGSIHDKGYSHRRRRGLRKLAHLAFDHYRCCALDRFLETASRHSRHETVFTSCLMIFRSAHRNKVNLSVLWNKTH